MSLRDEISALRSNLDKFYAQVTRKLTSKPAVVAQSDTSPLLGGKTPAELKNLADTATATHANNKNNPHGDTAASIGAYSKAEVDAMVQSLLPAGVLPLSRFGSLDYLPPDISGTFDGSTTVKDVPGTSVNYREQYSFQLENDGTLVYLRNGTNGSTQGVYYGYVKDAVNGLVDSNFVSTVTRYSPPFLTAGQTVAYLYQGGHGVLAGRIKEADGTLGKCFIALTNGTLDARAHTAVLLDAGYEDTLNTSEMVIGPEYLYQFQNPQVGLGSNEGRDAPIDIKVTQISLGNFVTAPTATTPISVLPNNITTIGFDGELANIASSFRLATRWQANRADQPALIYHQNPPKDWFQSNIRESDGHGRMMTSSIMSEDRNSIRIYVYHDSLFQQANLLDLHIEYSFTWLIRGNTAQLDSGLTKVTLSQDASGTLSASGTVLSGSNKYRSNGQMGFDSSTRLYVSEAGLLFSSRISHVASDNDGITRSQIPNYTSRYDALKAPMATTGHVLKNVPVMYGSAWGDSFDAPRLMPDNQIVGLTRNANGNRFARGRYGVTGQQAQPNYAYSSITQGNIMGFAPQTDRATVATDDDFRLFLNEVTAGGTAASGAVLNELVKLSSFVTLSAASAKSGTVSITSALMADLKAAVLTAGNISNVKQSVAELVIPQNSAMTPYVVVNYTTNGFVNGVVIAAVTLSGRTGAITSTRVDRLLVNQTIDTGITDNALGYNVNDSRRGGNHFVYEDGSTGFMVVGTTATLYTGFNYARYLGYRFYLNRGDLSPEYAAAQMYDWGVPRDRLGAFPALGVGLFGQADYTTKLLFRQYARTKADFATWAQTNQYVVMEQDVAQGWQVYFTNPTPVILAGQAYTLPVKMVDLRDITSSYTNKTFYLNVKLVNGVAQWDISLTAPTDSPTSLFIGTITTGASAISGINVAKQTRLDEFHISTTAVGQGIPVSSGLPAQTGKLDASWIP